MHYQKHVIATDMPLCYAIGMFDGTDARSFVVATEKAGPMRRFALDGSVIEDVAPGPGGVMTIAQVPGRGDQLLATYQFFSPNYGGDDAKIMAYTRQEDGTWAQSVVCDLPYVHRFGILRGADGQLWLLACTIKGACREVKNDWTTAGAVYAAPLGDRIEDGPVELEVLAAQQLQNHGFYMAPDASYVLVTTAAGVFRYVPPAEKGADWTVTCLVVQPTSDVCVADLDGDGQEELVTFSAFHGDTLAVWHATDVADTYKKVWTAPQKLDFLHAIWSGELGGQACAVIGNRKDGRDLLRLVYGADGYELESIDHDCGPANCWVFADENGEHIIAANRETNEVALYDCE